jgi:hypothetical protein
MPWSERDQHNFTVLSHGLCSTSIHHNLYEHQCHPMHPVVFTQNYLSLQNHLHKLYSKNMRIHTFLKSSVSSTCPSTYLTSECKMSRQWILFPRAMGKLKLTRATMLGLGIPRGGSRLAMKSDSWVKRMNCVAWGSYLHRQKTILQESVITFWSFLSSMVLSHKTKSVHSLISLLSYERD